ncbi:hypothetical protein DAEQUDRAFT_664319 [Daedalea quercina L-15889]|uniref:Uncharacterized protein n=1 Tax=Daedalea quercina L-15889 TaxID=1314783 RepID=A0A165SQA2_9APHY|nr:hypothetical protein DAEQUDRAFT_664319 [Daedalea quercina L-15889]
MHLLPYARVGVHLELTCQRRAQIREQVKTQVAEQVKAQLGLQIRQHLPEPLARRVEESRRQIEEVKHAVQNSEARSRNSALKTFNLDDPLDEVLKPDGTRCDLYPTNLRSLFAYTGTEARQLAAAYELGEHRDRENNINRFMAHIGEQRTQQRPSIS